MSTSSLRVRAMKPKNKLPGSYRNIVKFYNTSAPATVNEGGKWYSDARDIAMVVGKLCGYKYHKALFVGAGILSALSPQVEWGDNIQWAIELAVANRRKQTWANHNKALRIKNGEHPMKVLGGRKVIAFYKAIVAPLGSGEPVVDRHAVAIYMGRPVSEKELGFLSTKKVMDRIQWAYKKAGKELGVHHHQVQAVTWSQWRIDKGITKSRMW